MDEQKFSAGESDALERLDRFLSRKLDGLVSREKIKKCIQSGQVFINDQPCASPKRALLAGETIRITLPGEPSGLQPEAGELEIVFEDEHLAVLLKPHNLSVHPSPNEPVGTLVNRLLSRFPALAAMGGDRPGIVHRLDKDTTGLMLVALDEPTRLELIEAFARRDIGKEYLALVYGVPQQKQGRIDAPIGRDSRNKTKMSVHERARPSSESGAREARSDYRTLYADPMGRFSLLAVSIHSGRTHQIRVHLAHIGHPIVGDRVYGDEAAIKKTISPQGLSAAQKDYLAGSAEHQLLHAWRLSFSHPARPQSEALSFCAEPPPEFTSAAQALSERLLRVVLTGNPACGKSSVLALMRKHGPPIWSADEAVAREYKAGADAWRLIHAQYGRRFMLQGENRQPSDIDKRALFQAMYNDDGLRRGIEDIIHPIVLADMLLFWERLDVLPLREQLAVAEVPLFLETSYGGGFIAKNEPFPGFAPSRPLVIGIHCPFEIRACRMREKRSWPDFMIERIESWQWPEDKKMAACDLVIDNSGSPEELASSVETIIARLKDIRGERQTQLAKILDELTSCAK